MRQIYYNFIREQNINDILSNIIEISYSQKLKLLQNLQKNFSTKLICMALNEYDMKYIRKNRIQLNILYNTLKGICQRYKEKGII